MHIIYSIASKVRSFKDNLNNHVDLIGMAIEKNKHEQNTEAKKVQKFLLSIPYT